MDYAGDRDAGLRQHMGNFRLAQAGRVVFKREMVFRFVYVKFPQPIGIGEFSEPVELFQSERRLQFECDFEEGHAGIISGLRKMKAARPNGIVKHPR